MFLELRAPLEPFVYALLYLPLLTALFATPVYLHISSELGELCVANCVAHIELCGLKCVWIERTSRTHQVASTANRVRLDNMFGQTGC